MISWLKGQVVYTNSEFVILNVREVGYQVWVPTSALRVMSLGDDVSLFIHSVIREDSHTLFGFTDTDQWEFFGQLIKVNGVGPKTALAILSDYSVGDIMTAVIDDNVGLFSSVSGIGAKTAKRIILELKEKLPPLLVKIQAEESADSSQEEVVGALVTLGFRQQDIMPLLKELQHLDDVQAKIKHALKLLNQ